MDFIMDFINGFYEFIIYDIPSWINVVGTSLTIVFRVKTNFYPFEIWIFILPYQYPHFKIYFFSSKKINKQFVQPNPS